jgi:hypothetical protein
MRSKEPKQAHNKIAQEIANKAIEMYAQGLTLKQISKELKIGATTVKNYILLSGAQLRGRAECQNKIIFDKDFFFLQDGRLAYFWGFFLGDGSVSDNNGINRIKVAVNKKDISILENFCKWLSIDLSNIKTYQNYSEFYLRDKLFDSILMNRWGAVKNKTYEPILPIIKNKKTLKLFLIGLIDADGHIVYGNNKGGQFQLVGNIKIMEWFIDSIKKLGYSGQVVHRIYTDKVWSRVCIYNKKDIISLAKILKINECDFLLDRKWHNIKDFLQNEV